MKYSSGDRVTIPEYKCGKEGGMPGTVKQRKPVNLTYSWEVHKFINILTYEVLGSDGKKYNIKADDLKLLGSKILNHTS